MSRSTKKSNINLIDYKPQDFLNLSFSPPKRDIVEMMTPKKDTTSSEIIPYRENKSFLDFVVGGSPAKKKQHKIL